MGNMSYCRFRNTLSDLSDCADALDEMGGDLSQLGLEEAKAASRLIRLCLRIGEDYSELADDDDDDE